MVDRVRIGIVGTSWWADAMYLPALRDHPLADIRAVAGARPERTRAFAAAWRVPAAYDSLDAMLEAEPLDALLVLTPNALHHPMTMAALERGLHVLCEKPMAMSAAQAREMTETAEARSRTTMIPFTYAFMPFARYTRALLDEGWLGRPYHLDLRYYSGYARGGEYLWRFDPRLAGAGVAGDLGTHWLHLARSFFGEVRAVSAVFGHSVERPSAPDGLDTGSEGSEIGRGGEDSAILALEFENGATGSIHVSAVALEPTPFGQLQSWELHGSDGTLHMVCDWDLVQRVEGARAGDGAIRDLPIPDAYLDGIAPSPVPPAYKATFRTRETMARAFVTAVAEGRPVSPSFRDGWMVQRVLDAAVRSAHEGRRVPVDEIAAEEAVPRGEGT